MRIDVVTIFPELFELPLRTSIIGRAAEQGIVEFGLHDLREHGLGRHRSVDDYPYGGGAGMVMRPEPLFAAIEPLRDAGAQVILLDPAGEVLTDALARDLATQPHLALVCGRYEGIDERVRTLVDREVSIGDYVLTGGELPALVVIDTVVRLVPGAIQEASHQGDSFAAGLLEHPQYTRPDDYRGLGVPPVLVSGHHGEVDRWRRREALRRTLERRPDLLDTAPLTDEDRSTLDELRSSSERSSAIADDDELLATGVYDVILVDLLLQLDFELDRVMAMSDDERLSAILSAVNDGRLSRQRLGKLRELLPPSSP